MDALKEHVPADVLSRLGDSLQLREAARLGRAAAHRLQRDGEKNTGNAAAPAEADASLPSAGDADRSL